MYAGRMNRPSPVIPLMLLAVMAVGVFLLIPKTVPPTAEKHYVEAMNLGVAEAQIIEVLSGHAWQNHGTEVNDAFRCLNKYGSSKSFKTFGFTDHFTKDQIPTNLWMCFDPVSRQVYAVVTTYFEKVGPDKIARLVTAYRVGTDLFKTIEDFIAYIATKWGAVEIPYALEKGNILLKPQ